jgi:hypothetical protein
MTTPDQLREIVRFLQQRVGPVSDDGKAVSYRPPTSDEMIAAGLDEATVRRLVEVEWWDEMAGDVGETPEYAEPDATAGQILRYARDVIREHIGKKFPLDD